MVARHSRAHGAEIARTGRRRFRDGRGRIQKLGTTMLAAEIPTFPIPFARDGRFWIDRHPTDRVYFQACGWSVLNDCENGKIERRSNVIHNDQTFPIDNIRQTTFTTTIRSFLVKTRTVNLYRNKFLSHG